MMSVRLQLKGCRGGASLKCFEYQATSELQHMRGGDIEKPLFPSRETRRAAEERVDSLCAEGDVKLLERTDQCFATASSGERTQAHDGWSLSERMAERAEHAEVLGLYNDQGTKAFRIRPMTTVEHGEQCLSFSCTFLVVEERVEVV